MEQIPTSVYITIFLSISAWAALSIIRHNSQITSLQATQTNTNILLAKIEEKVDILGQRIDTFMKSEIDTLKDIAESFRK